MFVICINALSAADFVFNGNTSVYGQGNVDNNDYLSSAEHNQTDLYAVQNLSLGFVPDKSFRAQCDASLYGSVCQYTQDMQSYSPSFTLDINQMYVQFPVNSSTTIFAGKKVVNIGLSSNFPLVNRMNTRYEDPIRGVITEGTGVVGETLTPVSWASFTGMAFINSNDTIANYKDINILLYTNFSWKIFTLSIYSYFEHPFSVAIDWSNLASSNSSSVTYPAAFSGSVQLGLFTLYTELLTNTTENKYVVTGNSGNYSSDLSTGIVAEYKAYSLGARYVSTEVTAELEYEYNPDFYSADESDSLCSYFPSLSSETTKATVASIVHPMDGQFYQNNAAFSISYNPTCISDYTFRVNNLISFPSYGCSTDYIGDKLTCGISYKKDQSFLVSVSSSVGFGGIKSEFVLFDQNCLSVTALVTVFY
jgi:hypothetical protein